MKKRVFAIIDWRIDLPTVMYRVAAAVVDKMTGNKKFLIPTVPMADYEAGAKRLNSAIVNRSNSNPLVV